MDFLKELEWRGLLQDMSPGLEEVLAQGKVTGYIGFDPTAPSLTIGNYVPIMLLKLFQLSGHQPIVLMGGATGRIGDPSGKDKERELKSYDELDTNLEHQKNQMVKLLDFEREGNPAILVNNLDFYKDMPVLEFLRTVGKTLTVNYMMSKESVQKRRRNRYFLHRIQLSVAAGLRLSVPVQPAPLHPANGRLRPSGATLPPDGIYPAQPSGKSLRPHQSAPYQSRRKQIRQIHRRQHLARSRPDQPL
jgi:hypothetical protein